MLELSIIITSLSLLAIAAYTDLKTLEVPDWLNFAAVAAGLGIHIIFSLEQSNWWPIASSAAGFAIAFAIACLMFYTGQWGGGDAKLLMALGALIGFQPDKFAFSTSFLINLVFIGAAWGLLWSLALSAIHWSAFAKTFKALIHKKPYAQMRIISLLVAAAFIIFSFILQDVQIQLLGLALVTYLLCYLSIFIKSVELSCMHKWITPDKLTEGDWLVHAVKSGKTKIIPSKLGLEKIQVAKLQKLYAQKKISKLLVKYGVPFAPAFLLTFIATLLFNNVIFILLF